MNIDAENIIAACAAFTMMGAFFSFVTTAIVRREIAKLNGTYLRKELALVKFQEIEGRFEMLHDGRRK
jgi:hypothetical protein